MLSVCSPFLVRLEFQNFHLLAIRGTMNKMAEADKYLECSNKSLE